MKTKNLFVGFFCFALIVAPFVNAGHEKIDAENTAAGSVTFFDNVSDFLEKYDGNPKATIVIKKNEDLSELFSSEEFKDLKELQLWDSTLYEIARPIAIKHQQFDLMLLNIDRLDKLVLRGFHISKDDATLLAWMLQRDKKIKALELNTLSSKEAFLEPIIKALPATNIREFSVANVRFRKEDINALIKEVPRSKLRDLSLKYIGIRNTLVEEIAYELDGELRLTITTNTMSYKSH